MSNFFKGKRLAVILSLLAIVLFLKVIFFDDGVETIKRTNEENIDTKIENRNTKCSPFAGSYEKRVVESNKNDLFHYEKDFSLRCLKQIEDRIWVRTYLPDFRFKKPSFADNRSEDLFHRNTENTVYLRVQPTLRFTEVLFLRNGIYESDKFCGYKGAFDWIKQNNQTNTGISSYPVLAPVLSFDGFAFQHFLDGTIHLLVQILPFVQDRSVKILTYTPRDKILFDFLARLNISKSQLVFHKTGTKYHADLMIHSCIYDRLHPMLWHIVRTKLGIQQNLATKPQEALIIVITRDGCFNCGRRLLNQDEIVSILRTRYANDTVKLFKGPQTLDASIELFSKARIIIGSHGGGLYNMVFAPYGTTIIEFMPTKENGDTGIPGHQIFWKIANSLHHLYWRVALKPVKKKNMEVDLNQLAKLLDYVDRKS